MVYVLVMDYGTTYFVFSTDLNLLLRLLLFFIFDHFMASDFLHIILEFQENDAIGLWV